MTASPFFEWRLPVGSSASRIDGRPATVPSVARLQLGDAGPLEESLKWTE